MEELFNGSLEDGNNCLRGRICLLGFMGEDNINLRGFELLDGHDMKLKAFGPHLESI